MQINSVGIGLQLPLVITNILMEDFAEEALNRIAYKPCC
jgi:hypothetical protein